MAFDLAEYIRQHQIFSRATFGPHPRTRGIIEHLGRELLEVEEAQGEDLSEWADIIILAIDGATRSGATAEQICSALQEKLDVNRNRTWPDWRGYSEDEPIEHVKD